MFEARHFLVYTLILHIVPILSVWYYYALKHPHHHYYLSKPHQGWIPFFSNFMAFKPIRKFSMYANMLVSICMYLCMHQYNPITIAEWTNNIQAFVVCFSATMVGVFTHDDHPILHYWFTIVMFATFNVSMYLQTPTTSSLFDFFVYLLVYSSFLTFIGLVLSIVLSKQDHIHTKHIRSCTAILELFIMLLSAICMFLQDQMRSI